MRGFGPAFFVNIFHITTIPYAVPPIIYHIFKLRFIRIEIFLIDLVTYVFETQL
jgi:hypothetical protein